MDGMIKHALESAIILQGVEYEGDSYVKKKLEIRSNTSHNFLRDYVDYMMSLFFNNNYCEEKDGVNVLGSDFNKKCIQLYNGSHYPEVFSKMSFTYEEFIERLLTLNSKFVNHSETHLAASRRDRNYKDLYKSERLYETAEDNKICLDAMKEFLQSFTKDEFLAIAYELDVYVNYSLCVYGDILDNVYFKRGTNCMNVDPQLLTGELKDKVIKSLELSSKDGIYEEVSIPVQGNVITERLEHCRYEKEKENNLFALIYDVFSQSNSSGLEHMTAF